jgi:hypothetical protein
MSYLSGIGRCRLPLPASRAAGRGELRSAAGRRHRLPHRRIRNRICEWEYLAMAQELFPIGRGDRVVPLGEGCVSRDPQFA